MAQEIVTFNFVMGKNDTDAALDKIEKKLQELREQAPDLFSKMEKDGKKVDNLQEKVKSLSLTLAQIQKVGDKPFFEMFKTSEISKQSAFLKGGMLNTIKELRKEGRLTNDAFANLTSTINSSNLSAVTKTGVESQKLLNAELKKEQDLIKDVGRQLSLVNNSNKQSIKEISSLEKMAYADAKAMRNEAASEKKAQEQRDLSYQKNKEAMLSTEFSRQKELFAMQQRSIAKNKAVQKQEAKEIASLEKMAYADEKARIKEITSLEKMAYSDAKAMRDAIASGKKAQAQRDLVYQKNKEAALSAEFSRQKELFALQQRSITKNKAIQEQASKEKLRQEKDYQALLKSVAGQEGQAGQIARSSLLNQQINKSKEAAKALAIQMKETGSITEAEFKIMSASSGKLESRIKSVNSTMTRLGETTSKVRKLFVNMTRAYIAIAAVRSFTDFATESVKSFNAASQFAFEYGQGLQEATKFTNELMIATDGLVDRVKIQKSLARGYGLGVRMSNEETIKFVRSLTTMSQVMGEDLGKLINDVTTGIARQSRKLLDNAGIVFSTTEAFRAHYNQLTGVKTNYTKWVKTLSETQRAQIVQQTVLKALESKTRWMQLATNDLSEALVKGKNAWEDIKVSFAQSGAMAYAIDLVASAAQFAANRINDLLVTLDLLANWYNDKLPHFINASDAFFLMTERIKKADEEAKAAAKGFNIFEKGIRSVTEFLYKGDINLKEVTNSYMRNISVIAEFQKSTLKSKKAVESIIKPLHQKGTLMKANDKIVTSLSKSFDDSTRALVYNKISTNDADRALVSFADKSAAGALKFKYTAEQIRLMGTGAKISIDQISKASANYSRILSVVTGATKKSSDALASEIVKIQRNLLLTGKGILKLEDLLNLIPPSAKKAGRSVKDFWMEWIRLQDKARLGTMSPVEKQLESIRIKYRDVINRAKELSKILGNGSKSFSDLNIQLIDPLNSESTKNIAKYKKDIISQLDTMPTTVRANAVELLKVLTNLEIGASKEIDKILSGLETFSEFSSKLRFTSIADSLNKELDKLSGINTRENELLRGLTDGNDVWANRFASEKGNLKIVQKIQDEFNQIRLTKALAALNKEKDVAAKNIEETTLNAENKIDKLNLLDIEYDKKRDQLIDKESSRVDKIKSWNNKKLSEAEKYLAKDFALRSEFYNRDKELSDINQDQFLSSLRASLKGSTAIADEMGKIEFMRFNLSSPDAENKFKSQMQQFAGFARRQAETQLGSVSKTMRDLVKFDAETKDFKIDTKGVDKAKFTDKDLERLKKYASMMRDIFGIITKASEDANAGFSMVINKIGDDMIQLSKDLINFGGQLAWQATVGAKMFETDQAENRRANKEQYNKDLSEGLITQQAYNDKVIALDEKLAFEKKKAEAQAERDSLMRLGEMFFAKGLGYMAEAPAAFFNPLAGGPAGAAAYVLSGTALMGLGAALGYAGAGVTVPQSASDTASSKQDTTSSSTIVNIDWNTREDRTMFGRRVREVVNA